MEKPNRVFCLFEQSGTFKKAFKEFGIPAEDYDISNDFKETEHIVDLFNEIETAYVGGASIFDDISMEDLILAFFPCTYFSSLSCFWFSLTCRNNQHKPKYEQVNDAIARLKKRDRYHEVLYKLLYTAYKRNLRLIIENPATSNYLIANQSFIAPSLIDSDRSLRGDFYKKPTAYWFINCEPTKNCFTYQKDKEVKDIGHVSGFARSQISLDYARNFIKDFILGTGKKELTLFDL